MDQSGRQAAPQFRIRGIGRGSRAGRIRSPRTDPRAGGAAASVCARPTTAAPRRRADGRGRRQPQRVPRWADAYYFGIEDLYEVAKLMVDELDAYRQRFYEDQPQAGN